MMRFAMTIALLCVGCASGGVSNAVKRDLKKAVGAVEGPIELCYKSALESDAALEGEIVLKFEVAEGKKQATSVRVATTTIDEPKLQQCVLQEARELALSKVPGATLAVTYPLRFVRKSIEVE